MINTRLGMVAFTQSISNEVGVQDLVVDNEKGICFHFICRFIIIYIFIKHEANTATTIIDKSPACEYPFILWVTGRLFVQLLLWQSLLINEHMWNYKNSNITSPHSNLQPGLTLSGLGAVLHCLEMPNDWVLHCLHSPLALGVTHGCISIPLYNGTDQL